MGKKMKYNYLVMMSMAFYCYAHAADQPFTKHHKLVETFSDTDYLKNTLHSIYWGFGLGAMYGYNQCNKPPCDYEILYALIGTISAVIATPVCMKLYSKIGGYSTTDPSYRYYTQKTRDIRPCPYRLGHRCNGEPATYEINAEQEDNPQ